jgi:high-affinity iron transporter
MFPAGLITFRETFEIVLLVGIILTTLARTNQTHFYKKVWQGILAGVTLSLLLGYCIHVLFGGLPESYEPIFEGTLMFLTAGFLTWMILWVHKQDNAGKTLQEKVTRHTESGFGLGIFLLALFSVLREGVEAVLYLQATSITGGTHMLLGGMGGVILALMLGAVIFASTKKLDLSRIFSVVNVFLVLFAAGLVMHGVQEFQEVGLLPLFSFDPVVNLSSILNEEGVAGSFLHTLFGYTSTPSTLGVLSYGIYILTCLRVSRRIHFTI